MTDDTIERTQSDVMMFTTSRDSKAANNNADEKTYLLAGEFGDNATDQHVTCRHVKARHSLAFWGFLGFCVAYSQRTSFSVALVAMVKSTSSSTSNDTSLVSGNDTSLNITTHGEFDWDTKTQTLILGSYYYGYIWMQLCGGCLTERVGGRRVFGYGMFVFSVLTLITPPVSRAGLPYLIALRVVQGIVEAATTPALHSMWGVWAPEFERSRLAGFSLAGVEVGTVVGMVLAGLLCRRGFAGGWPSVFYVFGTCGCVWVILWLALVHDSPAQHPRITAAERQYIEASAEPHGEKVRTPWRPILTSSAVWGIAVAHFVANWGYNSMMALLPTYMHDVLHFDIEQNGVLSALPFLVLWVTELTGCWVADFTRSRGHLSTRVTRKIMNALGCVLPAVFLVAESYVHQSPTLAVILLTIGVGCSGFSVSGYLINHLDIAPRHAGTLFGLTNGVAAIPGFVGPAVLGALTDHGDPVVQWRIFFFITAGVYLAGAIIFGLLAKGEQQWWAIEAPTLYPPQTRGVSESKQPYAKLLAFEEQEP